MVAENLPVNTSVGQVSATDRDGLNIAGGIVTYELAQRSGNKSFWIDRVFGELYTARVLDSEVQLVTQAIAWIGVED